MGNHRHQIGSLAALFAFEASCRHGNFTKAASELGVTQAAVSKQMQSLERELGVSLFRRLHRRVEPTEHGHMLFEVVSRSLGDIGAVMSRLRTADTKKPLSIAATLAMSHFWLLPRLPAFKHLHPDIAVRVVSQDEVVELNTGIADMAIRFGDGSWSDGEVHYLFDSEIYPLASPGFLRRHGTIDTLDDLLRCPLIGYDQLDPTWIGWKRWLAAFGSPTGSIPFAFQCTRYADAIQAAVMDQGIVLGWGGLTGGLEEQGLLRRLTKHALKSRGSFYLVTARRGESRDNLDAFEAWIRREAVTHEARPTVISPVSRTSGDKMVQT
jgi:DNA-binding transcriptional LysR family regulator